MNLGHFPSPTTRQRQTAAPEQFFLGNSWHFIDLKYCLKYKDHPVDGLTKLDENYQKLPNVPGCEHQCINIR
jgi:hypothetical protein